MRHEVGFVAAARDVIGVSWQRIIDENAPENHATLVAPDGTLGSDIALSPRHLAGTGGTSTVLWHHSGAPLECHFEREAFDATLQRATEVVHVEFAPRTQARAVTFDGTQYVAFWITPEDTAHLRVLDEHGVLGPVIDLGTPGAITANPAEPCVSAASDGEGLVFLLLNEEAFFIDVATGAKQSVWKSYPYPEFQRTLYFAGEFHVADYRWFSIDRAGTSRERMGVRSMTKLFPGTTSLYGTTTEKIIELDRSLTRIGELPLTHRGFGVFEDDRIHFEQVPGGIVLSRLDTWQREIAFDSPVETVACE